MTLTGLDAQYNRLIGDKHWDRPIAQEYAGPLFGNIAKTTTNLMDDLQRNQGRAVPRLMVNIAAFIPGGNNPWTAQIPSSLLKHHIKETYR